MTLRSRNLLVFLIVFWSALIFILLLLFFTNNKVNIVYAPYQLDFGLFVNPSYKNATLVSTVSILFLQLYSAITSLLVYLIFKKNHTTEIVVLMVFLLANLFWAFRLFIPYTGVLIPVSIGENFIRLAYLGYFLSALAFLYGALYQADYTRHISYNLIYTVLALLFMFWQVTPIDGIKIYANNLMALADKEMVIGIYFIIILFIFLTNLMRKLVNKSYKNGLSFSITAGFLISEFFLFFASEWWHFGVGALTIISITFIYLVKLRLYSIWSKF